MPSRNRNLPRIELYSHGELIDYTTGFRRCDDALAYMQSVYPWDNFDEAVFSDTGMGDPPRLRNKPNYKQREALEAIVEDLKHAS
jgi:hypothetical protein